MSDHERTKDDGRASGTEAATPPEGHDLAAPPPERHEDVSDYASALYPTEALAPPPPKRRGRRKHHLVAIAGGAEPQPEPEGPTVKAKIKWLRLFALLTGLGLLATVSTVFGMMMAVASDLPALEVLDVADTPSVIEDRRGRVLGTLTSNQRRILVKSEEIAPVMKQALIAIEDKRFYEHEGVDIRGIARALWQDVAAQKVVQGGSTITQQLVKNRLDAARDRTVFQKLREAAIAFHMTRKWEKEKILQIYLNTIYFGNGAYGIEAAARTYFGRNHACGGDGQRKCSDQLDLHEAALLAGVIASPSAYDPIANPAAARSRRDLVLLRMLEQGLITRHQYESARVEPVPTRADIQPPQEDTEYPYFTTWVRQQVVDIVGASAAFEGGLHVETTIDADMQQAAEDAVRAWLGGNHGETAPAASMVALDNRSGEVLAMVGGPLPDATAGDPKGTNAFNQRPFNLATQGQRQPGSAFKPFILAQALRKGVQPESVWSSHKKEFCVTRRKGRCREVFEVNNYEDNYAGVTTLANATAFSDNSVYAEVGIRKAGLRDTARLANRLGIRTPVSANPAMTLGGLAEGVTVLDMAHAYQTFANRGRLPYGSLSPSVGVEDKAPGPVGIREIYTCEDDEDGRCRGKDREIVEPVDDRYGEKARNQGKRRAVLPAAVADTVESMLGGVVRYGTGKRAALGDIPAYGKTGTTEDYGDAWFVGWTDEITVAVWVGYPDEVKPMKTEFAGDPVAGGTFPAAIWQAFMKRAMAIFMERNPKKYEDEGPTGPSGVAPVAPTTAPSTPVPEGGEGGEVDTAPVAPTDPEPQEPQQQAPPPEEQAPAAEPETQSAEPVPDDGGGAGAPPG